MEPALALLRRYLAPDSGTDIIDWRDFSAVMKLVDPEVYTDEAMESLYTKALSLHPELLPSQCDTSLEKRTLHLEPLLVYIFGQKALPISRQGPALHRQGSLKKQKTTEMVEPSSPDVLVVRTMTGASLLTIGAEDLKDLLVIGLREKVGSAIGRCIDEVQLLVGMRYLEDTDNLESLIAEQTPLELSLVTVQVPQFDPEIPALQQLETLKRMLMTHSQEYQLDATQHLRKVLSIENDPPIDQVIQLGVVPRLIELVKVSTEVPALQFEALWALTNIASGTQQQTQSVVNEGAVPVIIQQLTSPCEDVAEQAVWAVGNIAGDSVQLRNLILSGGALQPMIRMLDASPKISCLRNTTWALANLVRGKPAPEIEAVTPMLSCLSKLLAGTDEEVLTDACWALSYISDGQNDRITAILNSNVSVERLLELVGHESPTVLAPALRTVGNIATGEDWQTQRLLDAGLLGPLRRLMTHTKNSIRKETLWTLSNILGGTPEQIRSVHEAGYFPDILAAMRDQFDVMKEAAWALTNASAQMSPELVKDLVDKQAVETMAATALQSADRKVNCLAIDFFTNLLEATRDESNKELVRAQVPVPELRALTDEEDDAGDKAAELLEKIFKDEPVDSSEEQPQS